MEYSLKNKNINELINKLSSNNSEYIEFNREGKQENYEIIKLKEGLKLYNFAYTKINLNEEDIVINSEPKNRKNYNCYTNKNSTQIEDNKTMVCNRYILNSKIKVFLIHDISKENKNELVKKLKNDIYGYIYMSTEAPHNICILIKGEKIDHDKLINIGDEIISNKDYINKYLLKEIEILLKYKSHKIEII